MDVTTALGDWALGPGPLHRKLADALRAALERGELAPGRPLPSERRLAQALAVSRGTVVAAYDELRAEGWLESRQGSGTRVRGPASAAPQPVAAGPLLRRLVQGPGRLLSLAVATVPAAPQVAEAVAAVAAPAELAPLTASAGYLPLGLPPLRREIAAFLTRSGLPTDEHQVLVTTGAQQAINLAARLLVGPGDTLVVEDPGLSSILDALRSTGARLEPVPVDGEGAAVDTLEQVLARDGASAVYLMPSFHNPTGAVLSESRRRRLARLVADKDLPLIEDNALEHARTDVDPPPPVAAFAPEGAPVLTVGTLSKVLWAGLRLGWVRAPETTIARLAELKVTHDLGSPLIDQAVAARLLPRLEEIRDARRPELAEWFARAGDLLGEHLPSWSWARPAGGLALWVELPVGDGAEFAQLALRHGVEVVPGAAMSVDGHQHRRHLRLGLVSPLLMEEAVLRLARAWASYAPGRALTRSVRLVV